MINFGQLSSWIGFSEKLKVVLIGDGMRGSYLRCVQDYGKETNAFYKL